MRRAYLFILSLLIAFQILLFGPGLSYAQELVIEVDTPIGVGQQSTPSAIAKNKINYELPYPGMLPDHPFYFLKDLRDKVVKLLINEDIVMAKFNLKYAEKNAYAVKMLFEKGKDEIALKTLSKTSSAFESAITAVKKAKVKTPKSLEIRSFLLQFDTSSKKSHEILEDIMEEVEKKDRALFEKELKRIKSVTAEVERMLKENK